jgi:hypothetical protein
MGFLVLKQTIWQPWKRESTRVTGLGEFSPIGLSITLGSFLKVKVAAKNLGPLFSAGKIYVLILTKTTWATILAIFSQTRLVTLELSEGAGAIKTLTCHRRRYVMKPGCEAATARK